MELATVNKDTLFTKMFVRDALITPIGTVRTKLANANLNSSGITLASHASPKRLLRNLINQ
jgi:hypothetical protein